MQTLTIDDLELIKKVINSTVSETVSSYPGHEKLSSMKDMLANHIDSENNEIGEIKKSIRAFLIAIIGFFLANIGVVIAIGNWVGKIETRQERNIKDIETMQVRQESIDQRVQKNDVGSAEYRIKLDTIEKTVLKIEQKLRR